MHEKNVLERKRKSLNSMMAAFTITEKGYSLVDGKGELLKEAEADFVSGPEQPVSYMGKAASF